jgi:hypothetical protein
MAFRTGGSRSADWHLKIVDPQGAEIADEPPAARPGRDWSGTELNQLGVMLVRGLQLEEIARCLRRDGVEVRGKVAEVGRACRGPAPRTLNRQGVCRSDLTQPDHARDPQIGRSPNLLSGRIEMCG